MRLRRDQEGRNARVEEERVVAVRSTRSARHGHGRIVQVNILNFKVKEKNLGRRKVTRHWSHWTCFLGRRYVKRLDEGEPRRV